MHTHRRSRTAVWFATGAAALLLAGCGDTDDPAQDPVVTAPETDATDGTDASAGDEAVDDATDGTTDEGTDEATAEPEAEPDAGPAAIEVELRDDDGFVFAPTDVSVEVGGTVSWVHEGRISHTVTASDGSFASGTIGAGDTFEVTFDEPGSYPYVCDFHGSMRGTVEVS